MSVNILSMLAVAGAWLGGLGVIFAVTCFCFGILRPQLLRFGFIYLLVTDVGLILMFAALLGILGDREFTLWVFSLIGLIVLVGLTTAAFIIIRGASKTLPAVNTAIETTRRRVEF